MTAIMPVRARVLVALVGLAAAAAGCSSNTSTSAPPSDAAAVTETEAWRAKHETDYRREWVTIAGLHFLIERVERHAEVLVDRLPGFRPLDQHGEVLALALQRPHQIAIQLEPAAALQDLLRFGLIFPEIG